MKICLADRETDTIAWKDIALPDILSGDGNRPPYQAAPNQHWMEWTADGSLNILELQVCSVNPL
ncbi:MAG: hypothetical protein IKE24_08225 [Clostridia bacterium]|nr:hypothetical protein [Clostridia bacterium]